MNIFIQYIVKITTTYPLFFNDFQYFSELYYSNCYCLNIYFTVYFTKIVKLLNNISMYI